MFAVAQQPSASTASTVSEQPARQATAVTKPTAAQPKQAQDPAPCVVVLRELPEESSDTQEMADQPQKAIKSAMKSVVKADAASTVRRGLSS